MATNVRVRFWRAVFVGIASTSILSSHMAISREIALTFDDAPRGDEQRFTGVERTTELIKQLKKAGVCQAAFFCNTKDMTQEGKERLEAYAKAGHVIANHTHSHLDLHQTEVSSYIDDLKQAHSMLQGFSTFRMWFRFPFLREGDTVQKRDQVRSALASLKYFNGYVTVDNYEWYMNKLFQDALKANRKVDFEKLRKIYVKVLTEGVEFYDELAVRSLNRSPKHILLLHENDLAALFVSDLVKELQSRGWSIIPVDAAYSDHLSKVEPDTLFLGQGRVAAIAHELGLAGPFGKWESESALNKIFETEL